MRRRIGGGAGQLTGAFPSRSAGGLATTSVALSVPSGAQLDRTSSPKALKQWSQEAAADPDRALAHLCLPFSTRWKS
ncbi:MAG: hypothetical protein J2P36_00315 [Ktedonobacteraceae bacterium]|nr:hypothetical protein [Ktedonobacteraceae bacterium]